jgi:hypothetical protein
VLGEIPRRTFKHFGWIDKTKKRAEEQNRSAQSLKYIAEEPQIQRKIGHKRS